MLVMDMIFLKCRPKTCYVPRPAAYEELKNSVQCPEAGVESSVVESLKYENGKTSFSVSSHISSDAR